MTALSLDSTRWAMELAKLAAAAGCGLLLTVVSAACRKRKRALFEPLDQAQILLCVTGALMMIVIGDSLARAFGVAGAAGIIRFRTPVEDPRDTIRMFLLLGLGMACGLGAFGLAFLGAIFLASITWTLEKARRQRPEKQVWNLELRGERGNLPLEQINRTLALHTTSFETRQVSEEESTSVKYSVALDFPASLERLNSRLLAEGGVRSIVWSAKDRKKEREWPIEAREVF